MDAVVYIGHGSRLQEGIQNFYTFIENMMESVSMPVQEVAFLELASPSIEETMEKVIQNGAKDILVVPVLLFSAAHFKKDIPEVLNRIQAKYPTVCFTITTPFDIHEKMVDLVVKRINACRKNSDGIILLVGRGSSDPEPGLKLLEIANLIVKKINMPVATAFLAVGTPSFDAELIKLEEQFETIYVMPYLLFSGLLLKRMESKIAACTKDVTLCGHLQYDLLMKEILLERMQEQYDKLVVV
ncbi:sirohydrochlorin chelatase [Niallia sp. 01092]|uniref:sirohydrochlorin chelatase n=1 Tax=unclassified Niallia TaxID=2837522 RepID=UPI003FD543EF